MQIYIAGISRSRDRYPNGYGMVFDLCEKIFGPKAVALPLRDESLATLPPEKFFAVIRERVVSARGVVSIWRTATAGPIVEATIASSVGIPQLIFSPKRKGSSRLIKGLPALFRVSDSWAEWPQIEEDIRAFAKHLDAFRSK